MNITREWLRAAGACYSDKRIAELIPPEGLPLIEALRLEIPEADRVWVATRNGAMSDRQLRLLAVRCARRALERVPNPDPRLVEAVNVAERFANGQASQGELAEAWADAALAADAGAWAARAASPAAYAATAWATAWATADAAAWAAAWDADADAAADAARDAERQAQVADLIELLGEGKQ